MNHTGSPEIRTARKSHRCDWCGESINKGQRYENTFIVWEGSAWRRKAHLECCEAEQAYDYDGDELYYPCNFQRGHIHEVNYYTIAEGVRAGCPGCLRASPTMTTPE